MTENKGLTIKEYLRYFSRQRHPNLFSDVCMQAVQNISEQFGHLESHETIMEIRLDQEERTGDYSVRVDLLEEKSSVREYWLEMDYASYEEKKKIVPCVFLDVSFLKPDSDQKDFYERILPEFSGKKRADTLTPMLKKVVEALRSRSDALYQLGAMTGREENDRLRVFTSDMEKSALLDFLAELGWKGDSSALYELLNRVENCSNTGKFLLDFDIFENSISPKIGINFGIRYATPSEACKLMDILEEMQICLPAKKKAVCEWLKFPPNGMPFIQNSISHFKLVFSGQNVLGAKAYLQQIDTGINKTYRKYFSPVQMNLELTTKCPLHCPQCYVHLNTGKELQLEKALYWIKEGAACGVQLVNLSGGETLCYPHLDRVLEECHRLSMNTAVALSGAYVTEERLQRLIDSGADEIYISLNGSIEAVDQLTRDGYSLAIHALELLHKMEFPNTMVNWVMHSHNADDFENMIVLCERYNVRKLVVLGFKPDSSKQLSSYPTLQQMKKIASIIKKYKGPTKIEVESCFSQLRALVLSGFLLNHNIGIERGCGAGRDGLSVNVDGKLTPCRHLDIPEEYTSMQEYWEKSSFLEKLRAVEEHRGSPCRECKLHRNCLTCADICLKLHGDVNCGMEECPLSSEVGSEGCDTSEDELILVDYEDHETGSGKKLSVHQKGQLHRAFSVFLFDGDRLLMQKRANGKYHSAGLWSNTCCSHPRKGEKLLDAAGRRLQDECGITAKVREVGSFVYRETFADGLSEYEYDHVLIGEYGGHFTRNPEEADEMKYVAVSEIMENIAKHPEQYSAWFITALGIAWNAYIQ